MARTRAADANPDDAPLKRLGGGRWQTRDERFTIEPQSGTWVIVDGEQTDDFGLPLVRGPFASLTAAREAIAGARSSAPAASPLADRIERRRGEPADEQTPKAKPGAKPGAERRGTDRQATAAPGPDAEPAPKRGRASDARAKSKGRDEEPQEPGWLAALEPGERGRARRLIARLVEDDSDDAEGLVRRDLVGDVPALAARAIGLRLAELDEDATPRDVAELLADGRDERLGVRWRLVDGDGRPILLEPDGRRRR